LTLCLQGIQHLRRPFIVVVSIQLNRGYDCSRWKGLEYHVMHLANSRADPTAVIEKLKEIMKSLGC
ncbi:unnamed protein product, partial [Brassica oleracea var. botrytis]